MILEGKVLEQKWIKEWEWKNDEALYSDFKLEKEYQKIFSEEQ